MNNRFLPVLLLGMSFFSLPLYSQTEQPAEEDTTLLGLPGDNLDLYAVLDLFQKSKTIEDFEKTLNSEEAGVNNLDLDLDGKVDFIKVETKKDGDDFTFILQVDVSKTEKQDVAVILVSKDENNKITMQGVGDEDLYGKDFVVDLNESVTAAVTANPAYKGEDAVITVPATTTTVVVESAPIVQYVYSPAYVPYYPPYYYGYYPPYFFAFSVMAVGAYHYNHYHYHGYGYGHYGHGHYNNHNGYNNYHNNSRNSSNTVNHNKANGSYNRGNASASTRPSTGTGASTRPSTGTGASTRPSTGTGASTRPSTGTGASTRPSTGSNASTRPNGPTRSSTGSSSSARPSTQPSYNTNRSSGSSSNGGSRGSGGYSGGASSRGGYSGGASRGGGSRGGGGGRRG